jgi:2-iminobutanoate/2-iminopropanoate deaminase
MEAALVLFQSTAMSATLRPLSASDAPAPISQYCEAMEVKGAQRWLVISGQTPVHPNGTVPVDFKAQARQVWANIEAQLRAANMTLDNLVKVSVFLADRRFGPQHRAVREEILAGRTIGLTVLICDMLDERHLLEIEAVAVA